MNFNWFELISIYFSPFNQLKVVTEEPEFVNVIDNVTVCEFFTPITDFHNILNTLWRKNDRELISEMEMIFGI